MLYDKQMISNGATNVQNREYLECRIIALFSDRYNASCAATAYTTASTSAVTILCC